MHALPLTIPSRGAALTEAANEGGQRRQSLPVTPLHNINLPRGAKRFFQERTERLRKKQNLNCVTVNSYSKKKSRRSSVTGSGAISSSKSILNQRDESPLQFCQRAGTRLRVAHGEGPGSETEDSSLGRLRLQMEFNPFEFCSHLQSLASSMDPGCDSEFSLSC